MPRVPRSLWLRAAGLLTLLALAAGATVLVDLPSVDTLRSRLEEAGPGAWLVVVLGQAIALMTPAPRSAISVLVGAVAGFTGGLALVLAGGVLGGLGGFALSRSLGREAFVRFAGRPARRLDDLVARRGVLAVVAARVMPMLPFMAVSYTAGLSSVRLIPYLIGTAIGVLPGSVVYVGIGASAAALTSWASPLLITCVVVAAVTVALAWRYSERQWSAVPTRRREGGSRQVRTRQ